MIEVYNCWTVHLWRATFKESDLYVQHAYCDITKGFEISHDVIRKGNHWVFLKPEGAFVAMRERNLSGTILQAGISNLPIPSFSTHHKSLRNSQKALFIYPKNKPVKTGKSALVCIVFDGECGLSYSVISQMGFKPQRVINYQDCEYVGTKGKFVNWLIYEMLDGERSMLAPGFVNNGGEVTR